MAELIDLPFGLWTRVGRRKYKFNRIRQVVFIVGHIGATWRIRIRIRVRPLVIDCLKNDSDVVEH